MAALVRIKRRLDEDPLETLVLNCKRRKTTENQNEDSESLSAVLRLAGTSQKEEHIDAILKKHRAGNAEELKDQYKKHSINFTDKLRAEAKESLKKNRYKVVNCFRKSLHSDEVEPQASTSSEVTVFDLESDENSPPEATNTDQEEMKYVYDFYYTSSDDFGEADIEDYVSVYPLNDPLVFGSARDNGLNNLDSDDESEDSNAEGNWRNSYPDEEDLESVNEDDMVEAVKRLDLEEDLLSSDFGEEDLVYSTEEEDFQDLDYDREDELRYGNLYAKFKAKNKDIQTSNLSNNFYYGDIDEDEFYY
ncbi:probable RNA polymerase II nuclear localization protein SLC7A6OS [Euwallacea similis]|uniref:probable RNA polymerase II nuclear localization protein SLC7A6OS n=1 Tax=Euwallacea similis TaxID=1736056 RepID=UPI00344E1A21